MPEHHQNKRITKLEEKVAHLERLNTPRQHNAHPIGVHENPQQHGQPTPGEPALADDVADNGPDETEHRNKNSHPWWIRMWQWKPWKRGLSIIVGFAGIGYAIVTYYQWHDLNHNFMVDERAWMKARVDWSEFLAANQVKLIISNVGKSVAISPRSLALIQVLPAQEANPSLDWRFKPHIDGQSGLDFPGDIEDPMRVPFFDDKMVVRKMNETEVKNLIDGKAYVAVSGEILYSDQFGKHWTRFCSWQPLSKDRADFYSRSCVSYNSVGDGDPPDNDQPKK